MRRRFVQFGKGAVRLVTHNFLWKLVALAGAVVIWALVASEPEISTFTTVRLEFRNLPPDIEIASPPIETATLELRGAAGQLRGPAENRAPSVVLDMADVAPGVRTYPIAGANVVLPRGVRLVEAFPSEVRFDFDRRAIREIPVQVRFRGGDHGILVASYTVAPDKLEIEGPASRVARVAAATTDPVAIPASGTASFHVNAFVPDPYVRFTQSSEVDVTVTTKKQAGP